MQAVADDVADAVAAVLKAAGNKARNS